MISLCRRLLSTRFSRFTLIGVFGAALNVILVAALADLGVGYVLAGVVANEITIVSNFIMQEKIVFNGAEHRRRLSIRFLHSFAFNTLEGLARMPFLYVLVEFGHLNVAVAQGAALVIAFFVRYVFHMKLVYAPLRAVPAEVVADDGAVSG